MHALPNLLLLLLNIKRSAVAEKLGISGAKDLANVFDNICSIPHHFICVLNLFYYKGVTCSFTETCVAMKPQSSSMNRQVGMFLPKANLQICTRSRHYAIAIFTIMAASI